MYFKSKRESEWPIMYAIRDDNYNNNIYNIDLEHNLSIKVDGVEIETSIKSLEMNHDAFAGEDFSLGQATSQCITIEMDKEVFDNLISYDEWYFEETVTIGESTYTTPIGYFYVSDDGVEKVDDYIVRIRLYDKLYTLKKPWVSSVYVLTGTYTRKTLIQRALEENGCYLATENFLGADRLVTTYNDSMTIYEWLTQTSERACGFVRVGRVKDDLGRIPISIIAYRDTDKVTIPMDNVGSYTIGEKYTVSKVESSVLSYYGDDTGITVFMSTDNIYPMTTEELQQIYYNINGFSYQNMELEIWGDTNIDANDMITVNGISFLAGYDMTWGNGYYGSYSTNVTPLENDSTLTKMSDTTNRHTIEKRITETETGYTTLLSRVDTQDSTITTINNNVSELNRKIQTIADITVTDEEISGKVTFENINASEPIHIDIHPVGVNIEYLYPRSNLYPSSTLKTKCRKLVFTTGEDEELKTFEYELPDDLLYFDETTYDEFSLDYETGVCSIIKKCGRNEDGSVYKLDSPISNLYDYPRLLLNDGPCTIEIYGYSVAYIKARLMASNIYTTQFATKAEVTSEIDQSATAIKTEVSGKYTLKEDTTELASRMTQTESNITAEVTRATNKENTLSASLELKIDKDKLVSEINAQANVITLTSDNFVLDANGKITKCSDINITGGSLNINDGVFKVTSGGSVTASNMNITGGKLTINGGSGYVAKFYKSGNNVLLYGDSINITTDGSDENTLIQSGTVETEFDSTYYAYQNGTGFSGKCGDKYYFLGSSGYGNPRWELNKGTETGYYRSSCVAGGDVVVTSDRRLKEKISRIDKNESVKIISELKPVNYNYLNDDVRKRGLIAQDVMETYSNNNVDYDFIVEKDENGYYGLRYSDFIPDLINCNKYLIKKVEELEEKINRLENK